MASRKPARSSFRPTLEHLETRMVPTVSGSLLPIHSSGVTLVALPPYTPPTPILLVSGTLYLSGDENASYAVVTLDTHNTTSTLDDQVVATINSGNQTFTQRFARSAVIDIVFQGNGGNDVFHNNTNINCRAYGGEGADTLYGGTGRDILFGDAGNDYLHGGAGNDEIHGGDGDDHIFGDGGSDFLDGGAGNDTIEDLDNETATINGGDGNDTIYAGGWIYGDAGDDHIYVQGYGINTIFGGADNDTIIGSAGQDLIYGGAGNDTIHGGNGNDTILGGAGDDYVYGDAGNDFVHGGEGNDVVYGGDNDDVCFGGGGSDSVLGNAGNDYVSGGHGDYYGFASDPGGVDDGCDDYLYGGTGQNIFRIGDRSYFGTDMDHAVNATSSDQVFQEAGWSLLDALTSWGTSFSGSGAGPADPSIPTLITYGHLSGTYR